MALSEQQISQLDRALIGYKFPKVYFDFVRSVAVDARDMSIVEESIRMMLTDRSGEGIRNGLANVLYWGYAQIGYRESRVRRFRERVSPEQLTRFGTLLDAYGVPSPSQVASLKMPEYSGISFISKILMFLDPHRYCVLDRQLATLGNGHGNRALDQLTVRTQIPVTSGNEQAYDLWRSECAAIGNRYFSDRYRVADVERGFFQLVQDGQSSLAERIYHAA